MRPINIRLVFFHNKEGELRVDGYEKNTPNFDSCSRERVGTSIAHDGKSSTFNKEESSTCQKMEV